ncbi:MAG: glycosyltransferase [Nitrososphaeria archaeon]
MEQRKIVFALNVLTTRSILLAKALGAKLCLIRSSPPYIDLAAKINDQLETVKPHSVVVQLPTGPLLLSVLMMKSFKKGFKLIADVHTGFLTAQFEFSKHGILNAPFKGLLEYVDVILLHNETNYFLLPKKLAPKATVLYDPFYTLQELVKDTDCKMDLGLDEYALFPASWHPDEPINDLIHMWDSLQISIPLVVTGRPPPRILASIRRLGIGKNVFFTGYLDYGAYLGILLNSKFVLSATTSDLDAQCSSFEALACGKPILASNTLALKSVLGDSAVYFDVHQPSSLLDAENVLLSNYQFYRSKVQDKAVELERQIKKTIQEIHDK